MSYLRGLRSDKPLREALLLKKDKIMTMMNTRLEDLVKIDLPVPAGSYICTIRTHPVEGLSNGNKYIEFVLIPVEALDVGRLVGRLSLL